MSIRYFRHIRENNERCTCMTSLREANALGKRRRHAWYGDIADTDIPPQRSQRIGTNLLLNAYNGDARSNPFILEQLGASLDQWLSLVGRHELVAATEATGTASRQQNYGRVGE